MGNFLEKHNLWKLAQEETENLNNPISFNEIKSIISNIPMTKTSGPAGYTGKCYQTFKGKDEWFYTKSFREASKTLISKPSNILQEKKITEQYLWRIYMEKNSQWTINKWKTVR